MEQLHPTPTKEHVRILCDDGSNDDELFVLEHDSDAWIWKRERIKSLEEAGYEVLGGGAGEGEGEGT
jgi:hypothetical protein